MERNNTGPPRVETKQTEKKRKTGKTSMKYSQKNKRLWEHFYLEEEHKICCMLDIFTLFSPWLGDLLNFHAKLA